MIEAKNKIMDEKSIVIWRDTEIGYYIEKSIDMWYTDGDWLPFT